MSRTAFHVVWTMRNRRSGRAVIEDTLASGPMSTRELAESVCAVEQQVKHLDGDYVHTFAIIEKPMTAAAEYWDSLYSAEWKKRRLKGES